eukprot:8300552-Pyramimonas_sp.AAC.1
MAFLGMAFLGARAKSGQCLCVGSVDFEGKEKVADQGMARKTVDAEPCSALVGLLWPCLPSSSSIFPTPRVGILP